MIAELVLFILSVLPVYLIGLYVYKKDRNKEPIKLLAKLFLGGILSSFMVIIVSEIIGNIIPLFNYDPVIMTDSELIIYAFIGVALIEESCKWIVTYKMSYNDREFDEFYDMILYSVMVALGFACFENLLYVYDSGIGTGIARALFAVPGHACDGMIMGYYLGLAKLNTVNGRSYYAKKNMIFSVLVPTITHGIYDYCLLKGETIYLIIFALFVIWIYIYSVKKIKIVSSIDRKI